MSLAPLPPSRRMLALWLPHWSAERARAKRSGPDGPSPDAPFAVISTAGNARRLAGVDRNAARLGLIVGMMLTEARALVPGLVAIEADPAGDMAALEALALWCRRWSPATATRNGDAILIDITGVAHLFGGEEGLIDDVLGRMDRIGYSARAAIADTGAAALALTRTYPRFLSAPGQVEADLAPLHVRVLDLEPETLARLAVMGLRRVGHLSRFGRAALRPRLGPEVLSRLDAVLGWRAPPLSPIAEPVPFRVLRRFAEPIERLIDVEATLAALAPALGSLLEKHGQGARCLALTLYRVDGVASTIEATAAAPLRDAPRITGLLRDRLAQLGDAVDPGFGFDLISLEVLTAEPLAERQADALAANLGFHAAAPLIDSLAGRLGLEAVRCLVPAASHVPERAVLLVPASAMDRHPDWSDEPWRADAWDAATGAPLARPFALLPCPELIAAVAEVPDGPPLRFIWRREAHRVIAADGPERIAGEWWHEEAPTRDYYRVEDDAGARFWIYRAGLYGSENPTPRWYMHGLFP